MGNLTAMSLSMDIPVRNRPDIIETVHPTLYWDLWKTNIMHRDKYYHSRPPPGYGITVDLAEMFSEKFNGWNVLHLSPPHP
jgi:hypothetical protein